MSAERGPPIVLWVVVGDDVGKRHRRGVQPAGHQASEVSHVAPERRTDLVGDGAELGEVQLPRVSRPAGDENLRPVAACQRPHLIHVDDAGRRVHVVCHRLVQLA
jgi:hypothetical protein